MKKILLILLLAILPIQYSWSAAAVYCQHEQGKVAHFGHHGHQHQASKADDDGKSKPFKVHGDCEVCHHAVQASLPGADMVAALPQRAVYAAPYAQHYLSHISDGPPRPNWSLAA